VTALETFVSAFHDHFTETPYQRQALGIDRDLGELDDPSLGAARARADRARSLLESATRIDAASLSFDDGLDLELARLMLESEIHRHGYSLNGKSELEQLPEAGDGIGDPVFLLMAADPRPAGERLADIAGKLEAAPDYLDAMLGRLDTPVKRWVDIDVEKVEGLGGLLDAAIAMSEGEGWADHRRLVAAADRCREAFARYTAGLGQLETTTALHIGDEQARELVRLRGIEPTFEQLHRIAAEFLAETRAQLEELRGRLAPKYDLDPEIDLASLHDHLNDRFAVAATNGDIAERIIGRYQGERDKILAFINERRLFPILADQDMAIIATPEFLRPSIPAGAMMSPPPFREGTRTSLVFLTILESQLDDHTELGIPSMMIHEGIPGHHLQLATASTHPSVVRRHIDAAEQAEGWTTMLEDYMLDVGYMGDLTDEARFVGKRDLSRIGARVAIDLYFMSGDKKYLEVGSGADISSDDPFVAAGAVLQRVTGFNPGRVQGELNWYSQKRGYPLCYLTGNRLVWQMKRAAASGSSGLSGLELDRRFHQVYLEAGNMPLSFLRRVMAREGLIAEA
jgi:uncharacterized protein (DUF885 family)